MVAELLENGGDCGIVCCVSVIGENKDVIKIHKAVYIDFVFENIGDKSTERWWGGLNAKRHDSRSIGTKMAAKSEVIFELWLYAELIKRLA